MQLVVRGLLSPEEDRSLLLSQFREYLEHDDIRYHTMQAASDTVARVTDGRPEVSLLGPWEQGGRRQWVCSIQVLRPGLWQVPLAFWNNAFMLLSSMSLPRQEGTLSSFYVKHTGECRGWEGGQEGPGRVTHLVTPCIPYRAVRQVEGHSSEGETPWTDGWLAFLGTT